MVLKNRDIYGFLCSSWVLITMAPRKIGIRKGLSAPNADRLKL